MWAGPVGTTGTTGAGFVHGACSTVCELRQVLQRAPSTVYRLCAPGAMFCLLNYLSVCLHVWLTHLDPDSPSFRMLLSSWKGCPSSVGLSHLWIGPTSPRALEALEDISVPFLPQETRLGEMLVTVGDIQVGSLEEVLLQEGAGWMSCQKGVIQPTEAPAQGFWVWAQS